MEWGWLKLTSSETGCCRVDLPCSMVPNRVEAGRCRTNLRQETTIRLDRLWTTHSCRLESPCRHCFGGALEILRRHEPRTRLEGGSGSFHWRCGRASTLPGLSFHPVPSRQFPLARAWLLRPFNPSSTGAQDASRQRRPRARIRSAKRGLHRALLAAAAPPRGRSSTIGRSGIRMD